MSLDYTFTALKGIQAGRTYYSIMCPLKLVPRIFLFDEEEISPELRAQRTLNKSRIPEIARYIIKNNKEYVFSSLTVSIDGEVSFVPFSEEVQDVGRLHMPMTVRFVINDGQHRRAAIEEALKIIPEIGEETISVVLFIDAGLSRSQQMFADLNKHAVRPTRSLGILYDNREPMARLACRLASEHPVFRGLTETEKATISNRSRKLFTLSSIYQGTLKLLNVKKNQEIDPELEEIARNFWLEVAQHITDWKAVRDGKISSAELRREYVHAHGIAMQAISIAGSSMLEQHPDDWKTLLKNLRKVDWARSNTRVWEGRAMVGGRISKIQNHIQLTANYLKQILGLSLTPEEQKLEEIYKEGKQEYVNA